MRKLLLFLVIGLVIYGIANNPNDWADATEGAGDKLATAADGVSAFITRLLT